MPENTGYKKDYQGGVIIVV